jgi:hypothetical protein
MTASETKRLVWQHRLKGFYGALEEAQRCEERGDYFSGTVLRASTFYSYSSGLGHPLRKMWNFVMAKWWAYKAARMAQAQNVDLLSHGTCDVIGTILLRGYRLGWFVRRQPQHALAFLLAGWKQTKVPPHARALLAIGIAEAEALLGHEVMSEEYLQEALSFEKAVREEPALEQSYPQFARALRRAGTLMYHRGERGVAFDLYQRARAYAEDKHYGSESQKLKLDEAWDRLHNPRLFDWLRPS